MKKVLPIAGIIVLALILFLGSVVVLVRLRGGAAPDSALAGLPGLGSVPADPEEDAETPAVEGNAPVAGAAPKKRDMSFLRQGSVIRLNQMADTLSEKRIEYERRERTLKEREQQLSAMEEQLRRDRDALRKKLLEQKRDIEAEAVRLEDEKRKLEQDRSKFREDVLAHHARLKAVEQENLKQLAESVGRMSPAGAAELLLELHAETAGDESNRDTVVKVMYLMETRLCAKIFDAMVQQGEDGRKLAAEVARKLRTLTKESPEGA